MNKSANMVVHPGYGNYTGTLVNGLVHHFDNLPELPSDYFGRPGHVHRLDKHTTGLMVVAKTENALTHLAKQFLIGLPMKIPCFGLGDLENEEGTIDMNLGRSPKNRKVMTTFEEEDQGKRQLRIIKWWSA